LDYKEHGGGNFPSNILSKHSEQGTFFTQNINDADWWIHVLEYQAFDKYDHPDLDGMIPVIIRFRLNPKKHIPDINRETPTDHLIEKIIPPMGLQVWNSKQWLPIAYWNRIDPNAFLEGEGEDIHLKQHYPMPKV
jgi:hypothetical protein